MNLAGARNESGDILYTVDNMMPPEEGGLFPPGYIGKGKIMF
jgi:hypothetical protein